MKIFIVEDDPWYGEILKYHLSLNPDNEVRAFNTGEECIKNLNKKPDVVCIDYNLPDLLGDKLLHAIKSYNKEIPVIVLSGQEEVQVAVELLKAGAEDYIVKGDNAKELLWNSIHKLGKMQALEQEVDMLKSQLNEKYNIKKYITGQSDSIKHIIALAEKASQTNINVSISGETGTGKEVISKAIHHNSARKNKMFIAVNMSAIPKDLLESELFGYEKGAFTGATARKKGKLEEANGGTLFLDEIGDMDLAIQAKLLRVLQERELVRLGGNATVKLDFRLITATHKDLRKLVENGLFREDLYYRVSGLPIYMPALRERGHDILILAKEFVNEFVKSNNMSVIKIGKDAASKLLSYSFPGNIRELKTMIDLACVMCIDNEIKADDLIINTPTRHHVLTDEKTLKEYVDDIIEAYLKKYKNVKEVARRLDIGKSTIYNLIKSNPVNLET